MFDWIKNIGRPKYPTWDDVPPPSDMEKIVDDMSKVVPFPELKAVPPPAPKEDTAGKTCYSLGLTDNNRVSLHVGYSSVTMNATGVQNLIDHLELLKSQIEDYE